jgi:PAS domain S-box-containing protein
LEPASNQPNGVNNVADLSPQLLQQLKARAEADGVSLDTLVHRMLQGYQSSDSLVDIYQNLFETLPEAIYVLDEANHLIGCNNALVTRLDYSRAEMLAMKLDTIVHKDNMPAVVGYAARIWNGETVTGNCYHVKKSGQLVPVEFIGQRIQFGERPAILVVSHDITKHRQLETALRASEGRFKLAAQIARLGIWDWDIETDKTNWYGAMFDIYGVKPEEFTGNGTDYIGYTREDYRQIQVADIENAFKNGYTEEQLAAGIDFTATPKELCLVLPDGTERYTLSDAIAIVNDSGTPIRMLGVTIDITDIKHAEQKLRESEEKFTKSFYGNPTPMQIVSLTAGTRIAMNDSFYQLFGYAPEVMLRTGFYAQPVIWRDPHAQREVVNQLATQGYVKDYFTQFITASRQIKHILVSASTLDVNERDLMIISYVDITDRVNAETEIRNRDTMLKAVNSAVTRFLRASDWRDEITHTLGELGQASNVQRVMMGEIWVDPTGRYRAGMRYEWDTPDIMTLINVPALQDFDVINMGFGNLLERLLKGEHEQVHSSDQELYLPESMSRLSLPIYLHEKLWGLLTLISTKEFRYWSMPEIDTLQIAADMLGAVIERRQAEDNEQHRRKIAESMATAMGALATSLELKQVMELILGQMGTVIENDRSSILQLDRGTASESDRLTIVAIAGVSNPQQMLGASTVLKPDSPNHAVITLKRPMTIDNVASDPPFIKTLDPTWLEGSWLGLPLISRERAIGMIGLGRTSIRPFTQEEIQLGIAFASHVAVTLENVLLFEQIQQHATKLEHRVRERTAQLESANEELRILSGIKDEFVANVSHELRTPITSIKMRQYLLEQQPEQLGKHLSIMIRETGRLERIVGDLLTLSRLDQNRAAFDLQPSDLNQLIRQFVSDRTIIAQERNISLHSAVSTQALMVLADTSLLEQVLGVLITNALNYTPSGGSITVTSFETNIQGQGWVCFSIADTGPGIPISEQDKLFTRFFRGTSGRDSGVAGTGLGLAIAKEIVDRHEGQITVSSDGIAGHGTTFIVWLPVTHELSTSGGQK